MPTDDVTLTGYEREAFEAWYKSHWSWTDDTVKRAAEEGWQARAALRPPAPAVAQEAVATSERLALCEATFDLLRTTIEKAPLLPLSECSEAGLAQWDDAITTIVKNISAEHVTRAASPTEQPAASAQGRETANDSNYGGER